MPAHMRAQPERLARGPATEEWARIDPMVYVTAARQRQAQATAEVISAGWRGIRRGVTSLASLLRRHLFEPIARRTERQRALAGLAAMDDRLLADIGLRRGDIELAVDGSLADPRMRRREPARADLSDRLLQGERCPAPTVTANANRAAPAQPHQLRDLAA